MALRVLYCVHDQDNDLRHFPFRQFKPLLRDGAVGGVGRGWGGLGGGGGGVGGVTERKDSRETDRLNWLIDCNVPSSA